MHEKNVGNYLVELKRKNFFDNLFKIMKIILDAYKTWLARELNPGR